MARAAVRTTAKSSRKAPGKPAGEIDLSLVVPCFNEAAVLDVFFARVVPVLQATGLTFEIVCVNDGSKDATLPVLSAHKKHLPNLVIIDLARNFGKEAALTAGVDHARGRAVIPIDADLQDPPELIGEMVKRWQGGAEVVLAQRADRSADSFLKRVSAGAFYRMHNKMAQPQLPHNVGDFRLMDRAVVDVVKQLPERQRFMKGLFSWPGFSAEIVPYVRAERAAGQTAWSYWRLWNLALDGITGFTTLPLRLWSYLGLAVFAGALLYAAFIILRVAFFGVDVPGFASLLVAVLVLGGLQMIGIGILGEYIGRIQNEVKGRPIYVVRKIY
ncbi:MAG: glycosyltransferase family 2 protein [Rhodobiaceae bacterium]|nr:glycosyltransferase family 2 protein [Rhodobiaceae bacterium]